MIVLDHGAPQRAGRRSRPAWSRSVCPAWSQALYCICAAARCGAPAAAAVVASSSSRDERVPQDQQDTGWTFSRWVGIDGSFSPRATAVSLLLVATLYAGPLYAYFRARRLPSGVDSTLLAMRNYLVVGCRGRAPPTRPDVELFAPRTRPQAPVAEEWIFRGCILPPLLCAGFGPAAAALTAPLFFGAGAVCSLAARGRVAPAR